MLIPKNSHISGQPKASKFLPKTNRMKLILIQLISMGKFFFVWSQVRKMVFFGKDAADSKIVLARMCNNPLNRILHLKVL